MVDVTDKEPTDREAHAEGFIRMNGEAFRAAMRGSEKKGDVLAAARIAGIMAAKRTSELIPLCHLLPLTGCSVNFELPDGDASKMETDTSGTYEIRAVCTARTHAKTGVEMEALTGVSAALLTIYDMCKALDRAMEIREIRLIEKSGGKSGTFIRV